MKMVSLSTSILLHLKNLKDNWSYKKVNWRTERLLDVHLKGYQAGTECI